MKRIWFLIVVTLLVSHAHSQDTTKPVPKPYYPYPKPFPPSYGDPLDPTAIVDPKLMYPVIGVGPGILTYFGDVKGTGGGPSISRLAYHLTLSEYLSRSLMISARAMFGSLSAGENGPRFANFESSIRSGGLNFTYNFDNFLPKKRRISPFVLTGIEYFEFLSKTDMYDANNNKYYYWKDGSIKSIDETSPNAANAFTLSRDYTYETDIRKLNNELFGKYPERSFALPVGAGVNFHLAPRWNFKLGATMHFTFTDQIDGVTEINKGVGKGDKKKDKYLETYFTITFDLFNPKPPYISPLTDADFLALETEDGDGDGVTDFDDKCPGTPSGVTVDAGGCPPDTDGDRIPDYLDKEINSPIDAWVDEFGVAMDDSTIARNYRIWSDSTGQYMRYDTIINPPAIAGEGGGSKRDATIVYRRELVILLGTYKEGVPPTEMSKLLSVPDVRSGMQPDSTTAYTSGSFNKTADAEKRRDEMKEAGFANAKVMVRNRDGSLAEPTADVLAGFKGDGKVTIKVPEKGPDRTPDQAADMKGVVYRVQLGAYSKKLSSSVFAGAGQTIELKTEGGVYKYMSGGYSTVQEAMKQRDDLVKKGYNGAFVVAYKGNKRVPLSSVSGGLVQPKNESMEEPKTPKSAIDKNLVSFRVQVGAFTSEPPVEITDKLNKIPGLERRKKSSGVNQYVAGKFNSYEQAKKFRDEIAEKYGVKDAFLVAFFKEESIPVQEAVELLK